MGKALLIAKYVISKCLQDGYPITNQKLQIILYFIQVIAYQKHNEFAFDEEIEAWQFGTVVPMVYYEYCNYAGMPILEDYDVNADIEINIRAVIDDVIREYAKHSAWDLVNIIHTDGSAWNKTYVSYEQRVIPKKLIKEEFIR